MSVDKLLIANQTALQQKYGPAGLTSIQQAVGRLITADQARGLVTEILYIDDHAAMQGVGGQAVIGPQDERGAKAAVDAAAAAFALDYILLLDGPDVLPHIQLDAIAGLDDGDPSIPSDLPYASPAPWSRKASDHLEVTRVVGRLPATPGETDPSPLIFLLDTAANHQPRSAADYGTPFAITADVWTQSTQLSVATTFGAGHNVYQSPPGGHTGIDPDLQRLAHFINCHGAQAADEFYGQHGVAYPTAMSSSGLSPNLQKDTVATAECCYGAELYDHRMAGTAQPICMAYMRAGAAAYIGSTNIAYGPASGNAQADLLTQYVLQYVLRGASSGRALLQARQDFIRSQVMSSPANLKTIAQFLLLGDPSVQPCRSATDEQKLIPGQKSFFETVDKGLARKLRRSSLAADGITAASTATWPGRRLRPEAELENRIQLMAHDRGMARASFTLLEARGGPVRRRTEMKSMERQRKVAILVERDEQSAERVTTIRLLVAHVVGNQIVRIEESQSRSWRSSQRKCTDGSSATS